MDVEQMSPDGWERVRAVRLRALRDAPEAFGTTLEEARAMVPEIWRERLASPIAATFLATSDGKDVGLVVGADYVGRPGAAGLFSLWVSPSTRGTGVADPLVQTVIDWARSAGYERVLLDVADTNLAAVRLYERNGFVPTGVTGTLPAPRTHIREHERALEL